MNNIHQPWNEWDQELNIHGDWLLVGALACASLPAIPGLIGLFALLYNAVVKSEPKSRQIFKRRHELKQKFGQGVATDQEKEEHYIIIGSLNVNRDRRNTVLFKLGYVLWASVLAYQFWKMFRADSLTQLSFG